MKKPRRKKVELRERKLGRENAHGIVHNPDSDNPLIEIDPRLAGFDRLLITVHEAVHVASPSMAEARVISASKAIASVIWAAGYRRVDQ